MRIHILEKQGLPFWVEKGVKRKAFFLGIFLCGMLLLMLSGRIWNIHIEGNRANSTPEILKFLEDQGVSHGMKKKSLNCSAIAASIREEYPQTAWVSARTEGTRLVITVKEGDFQNKKKKETASEQAQKLMLTWLVTYPNVFDKVAQYLTPEDFVVPLYREVAQMLFQQREEGQVNPAKLLNSFTDSEEQREVASLFNATIHLENQQEQDQAFADTLLRIKSESLAERNRNWDPTDMAGLQQIVKAKKELEELGRKRRELHISFE